MFNLKSICYPWAKSVAFGFLSGCLRLAGFSWKWEKALEFYKDQGGGNNCFIRFIQLVTQMEERSG